MNDPRAVEARASQLAVSSSAVIAAWSDLRSRGRLAGDPDRIAAALEDLKGLVRAVEGEVSKRVETFSGTAVNHLIREAVEHGGHHCTCRWCPRGTQVPPEP